MNIKIINDTPIALYNSEKLELVGIFKTKTIIGKYLYEGIYEGVKSQTKSSRVHVAISKKYQLRNTRFEFPVALRYANKKQIEILGDQDAVIFKDYPPLILKGFHSTRYSLHKEHSVGRKTKNKKQDE
jgi:hypothetical protein